MGHKASPGLGNIPAPRSGEGLEACDAELIAFLAGHVATAQSITFSGEQHGASRICSCGERIDVLYSELSDDEMNADLRLALKWGAHLHGELEKFYAERAAK